jgi:hypothetical protein
MGAIHHVLASNGGIAPVARRRGPAVLLLDEREEISRGIAAGRSIRGIAAGLDPVREPAHRGGRPLENDAFEAVVVVEVNMHRRNDQVMVLVLRLGQPFGERPLVVIVDMGRIGDTVRTHFLCDPVGLDFAAQEVAHRLGTARVAALSDQSVEFPRQTFVDRHRDAFHRGPPDTSRRVPWF